VGIGNRHELLFSILAFGHRRRGLRSEDPADPATARGQRIWAAVPTRPPEISPPAILRSRARRARVRTGRPGREHTQGRCADLCCTTALRAWEELAPTSERGRVDHEAVPHVAGDDAIVGLVDLLAGDDLDVGTQVVLGAEVEHLLRLPDAANH
jgi:hypothetical protein